MRRRDAIIALAALLVAVCIVVVSAARPQSAARSHTVTRTVTKPSPLKPGVYHEKTAEQQYIVETTRPVTRADDVAACKARHRKLVEVEHNESPLRDLITCSGGSG